MIKAINNIVNKPVFKFVSWCSFSFIIIFSFFINLLTLAIPIFSLQVFDRVLTSRSVNTLIALITGAVIALFLSALIDLIRAHSLIRIANSIDLNLNPKMMDASINMASMTGKVSSQAIKDVISFKNFMSGSHGLITLLDAPWIPVFFFVVWLIHPLLVVVMFMSMVLLLMINVVNEFLTGSKLKEAGEISLEAQHIADEIMRNSDAVRAMGMKNHVLRHWFSKYGESTRILSETSDKAGYLASAGKFTRFCQNIAMTGVGAYLAINNEITVGSMIAANILSSKGTAPLEGLINSWKNYINTKAAADRLNEMFEEFYLEENKTELPVPVGKISVEKAVYVPAGGVFPILKGISFEIPAGKTVAFLGASGAGKSTLAKVMTGIYKLRSGSIKLDNADVLNVWSRDNFGRYVGYLPQEIMLFSGTVRDNIARFSDATDDEVIAAAIETDAHKMILQLPHGYDTIIGSQGVALSGGQKQRIGLARAFFANPKLIVLDEPNAFLDSEGELALISAIKKAKSRKATVVVITHKLSLVTDADILGVISDGLLQMYGPHYEVIKQLTAGSLKKQQMQFKEGMTA